MRYGKRWLVVVAYAIGMAWVESAVVYYLRSSIGRIEPYQAHPLPLAHGFARAELVREAATLLMLWTVGWLAGTNQRTRLAYSVIAFGVWDIFYYVFLKVLCDWPHSLLDWDVLFLLPLPWWGPVLAPVLIASLMILGGTLVSQFDCDSPCAWPGRGAWFASISGIFLALYVFITDAINVTPQGADAVREMLPQRFHWLLFLAALALMAAPVFEMSCKLRRQKSTVVQGITGGALE